MADIMVVGSAPAGKAIFRSGARPGDLIYVTGALGGAAATLDLLYSAKARVKPSSSSSLFSPRPRVAVARVLREENIARSMIDISDGLSTDLSHICDASGVGAEIQEQAIPLAKMGKPSKSVETRFALHGGDDYELLFTARPNTRVPRSIAGVPITAIGRITRRKGMRLIRRDGSRTELKPHGWEHFATASKR